MSAEMLEQSLLYPKQSVELGMTTRNVMSRRMCPSYHFQHQASDPPATSTPTASLTTSGELDDAVDALSRVFQDMLRLARDGKDHPAAGGGD